MFITLFFGYRDQLRTVSKRNNRKHEIQQAEVNSRYWNTKRLLTFEKALLTKLTYQGQTVSKLRCHLSDLICSYAIDNNNVDDDSNNNDIII